jgi:hypothetical protein
MTRTPTPKEIVEAEVTKYIQENEVSPFVNIEMKEETNELNVDMDANFEALLTEQLGDDLQQGMSDYFTDIIKDMIERMENGEDIDFVDEDSSKGIPEAP